MTKALLHACNLQKRFGGVVATDIQQFTVAAGETHAVIGPNGAGKSTLLAQLAGEIFPDSGHIAFQQRDITRWPAHRRCRAGIARSFQITSLMTELDVLGNVLLAVLAHQGHSYRFWRSAYDDKVAIQIACEALEKVGLADRGADLAGALSHGEQRQLEVAMASAIQPTLLLLDEPMAGMGSEESTRMIKLVGSLKDKTTIILVEHDMDAVFAVADRISVLVAGQVIASGSPDEIRNDVDVARAYLGESLTC